MKKDVKDPQGSIRQSSANPMEDVGGRIEGGGQRHHKEPYRINEHWDWATKQDSMNQRDLGSMYICNSYAAVSSCGTPKLGSVAVYVWLYTFGPHFPNWAALSSLTMQFVSLQLDMPRLVISMGGSLFLEKDRTVSGGVRRWKRKLREEWYKCRLNSPIKI